MSNIYKPHPYQQYCINRLITNDILGLFLEPGLGKTGICLTAVNDLKYNRFQVSKVLVIAPLKISRKTWSDEAQKWDHLKNLRVSVIKGPPQQRIRALSKQADIYTVGRECVNWLVEYCRNAWPFDMVILDESTSFKNSNAKRWKSLKRVRPHIKRLVLCTGTPATKGAENLWAQVYLLDGGERLGKTKTAFRDTYLNPDKRGPQMIYSYKAKPGALEAVIERIKDICIVMREEDYLQLPPLIERDVKVSLDAKALKAYEQMEKEALLELQDDVIDAASAAAVDTKLLQIASGACYDENRKVIPIHDCKLNAFTELLGSLEGNPVLVFYNFQHELHRIEEALKNTKLRVRRLQTTEDEDDWNNRKIDVLLTHPKSAAYGLNLQSGGNHQIWFGLNWSLELYLQAIKRLHRQGQTEKVIIHRLVAEGTREEDVINAWNTNNDIQETILNSLKIRIDKYRAKTKM